MGGTQSIANSVEQLNLLRRNAMHTNVSFLCQKEQISLQITPLQLHSSLHLSSLLLTCVPISVSPVGTVALQARISSYRTPQMPI